MSMEEYGKLMINYQHHDSQTSGLAKVNRSSGQQSEGNIDWTNECVFQCRLCQPARRFNSKVGQWETY